MPEKVALFIGRFQPYHNGHDFIIRQALDEGKAVVIAVRDTPESESDPYSLADRIAMIKASYYGNSKVKVIPGEEIVDDDEKDDEKDTDCGDGLFYLPIC